MRKKKEYQPEIVTFHMLQKSSVENVQRLAKWLGLRITPFSTLCRMIMREIKRNKKY